MPRKKNMYLDENRVGVELDQQEQSSAAFNRFLFFGGGGGKGVGFE